MSRFMVFCGVILFLSSTLAALPAHAQIWDPDLGRYDVGIGYQYQRYHVFGKEFQNNGVNGDFAIHIVDALTSVDWRINGAIEATLASGFGGHTTGKPDLQPKSVFFGAGPHLAIENRSRIEPWAHLLLGVQHFRVTQGDTLGSNSAFGFMLGGGADIRLLPRIAWRIQTDYMASTFLSSYQSNFSIGTGLVFNF